MHQQRTLAPSALRHALRALLLLGGVFVCWLLLSGGPAQASDDPTPSVGQVTQSVTQSVDQVRQATDGVSQVLRQAPSRLSGATAQATKGAAAPVPTTVATVTGATQPVLTLAVTLVTDTLDRSVHTTQAVVDQAVRAPGTGRSASLAATVPGASRHALPAEQRHAVPAPTTSASAPGIAAVSALWAPAFGPRADKADGPLHGPDVRHGSAPSVPVTPGSSAGGQSAAGVLAGFLVLPATSLLRRHPDDATSLPTGPAYPPGTSPG